MSKIIIPHTPKSEFSSLKEAVQYMQNLGYTESLRSLKYIVMYNPQYMNHLRRNGLDSLIGRLVGEMPELEHNEPMLRTLRNWATETPLMPYNLKCYDADDAITILGHSFENLEDIRNHTEIIGCQGVDGVHCWSPVDEPVKCCVHIGKICDGEFDFNQFDCYLSDYNEFYIFRKQRVLVEDMEAAIPYATHIQDYSMNDKFDLDQLPILCINPHHRYMIFVTHPE